MKESFSKGALELLNSNDKKKFYVYRLVDPRTLHTFYVGKGCGNRVFDHAKAAKELISEDEDMVSLKYQLISEIIASGKEFEGKETKDSISSLKGMLIPFKYRKKGMARPFLYKR